MHNVRQLLLHGYEFLLNLIVLFRHAWRELLCIPHKLRGAYPHSFESLRTIALGRIVIFCRKHFTDLNNVFLSWGYVAAIGLFSGEIVVFLL